MRRLGWPAWLRGDKSPARSTRPEQPLEPFARLLRRRAPRRVARAILARKVCACGTCELCDWIAVGQALGMAQTVKAGFDALAREAISGATMLHATVTRLFGPLEDMAAAGRKLTMALRAADALYSLGAEAARGRYDAVERGAALRGRLARAAVLAEQLFGVEPPTTAETTTAEPEEGRP